MKITGHGLLEVSKEEDAQWFLKMYKMSHWQNIVENNTFRVSQLRRSDFQYVAFLEAGGGINRLVELGEKDFLEFFSQLGLSGYSNTSGMGYVRCYEHDGKYDYKELAMFCLDNSPYDLNASEVKEIMENERDVSDDLVLFLGKDHDSTLENTLYVIQL
ncbi:hypothetical protein [Acinetobacter sp.]|uniref:hypothetical protein n=1 Tax=Acinetobacter sp. TaxID=472 RepID=UPI00388F8955